MTRRRIRSGCVSVACLLIAAGSALGQVQDGPDPAPAPAPVPAPQPASPDSPNLEFVSTNHNFGKIYDVDDVQTTIKFKNSGKTALVIQKPTTKCGCTVGELKKLEYAPGEEGELEVTFHPQGKHGPQNQPITITSNDPDEPQKVVYIEAEVRKLIHIDPPMLQFGPVVKGESKSMIVRVSGSREGFKAWHATATNRRHFAIKVLGTGVTAIDGEPMSTTEVEVTVHGTDYLGELAGDLCVRTNDPRQRLASLKVAASVVGDIRVVPEKLALGMLIVSSDFERTMRLSSRSGADFEILGVRGNSNLPGALEFETVQVDPAKKNEFEIVIKGKSPDTATPVRGVILVTTNNADQPEIRVPFYGVVQADEGGAAPAPGDAAGGGAVRGGGNDDGGGR